MANQIVDVNNFECILKILTLQEYSQVLFRLGWLNIWSPLKPEGCYSLDLSVREENIIARILIVLDRLETNSVRKETKIRDMRIEGGTSCNDTSSSPHKSKNSSSSGGGGSDTARSHDTVATATTAVSEMSLDEATGLPVWNQPPINCENFTGNSDDWLTSNKFPVDGKLHLTYHSALTESILQRDDTVKCDPRLRLPFMVLVSSEPPVELIEKLNVDAYTNDTLQSYLDSNLGGCFGEDGGGSDSYFVIADDIPQPWDLNKVNDVEHATTVG